MKRTIALGIALVVCAAIISGCVPKEIRTAKIELGTRNKPKPNPNIERVKENLTMAMELYPDNPEVYYLWGWVQSKEGNWVEMDKAFKRVDELGTKYKAVCDTIRMTKWKDLVDTASTSVQDGDFEKALENFKFSIICWPDRFEPYMYGADAARRIDKLEEAYELSFKAYKLAPDSLRVIELYADMCTINNKLDEAAGIYLKVLEKDPTNVKVMSRLAEFYRLQDDTSKAIQYLEQAVKIDPENIESWFNIGLLYFQLKDFCKAAESFERVAASNPEDLDARINYLLSLVQCGELETARTELEKFTMEHPDNCDGWDLLSQTYVRLKMKKEAHEAFKKYEDCEGK